MTFKAQVLGLKRASYPLWPGHQWGKGGEARTEHPAGYTCPSSLVAILKRWGPHAVGRVRHTLGWWVVFSPWEEQDKRNSKRRSLGGHFAPPTGQGGEGAVPALKEGAGFTLRVFPPCPALSKPFPTPGPAPPTAGPMSAPRSPTPLSAPVPLPCTGHPTAPGGLAQRRTARLGLTRSGKRLGRGLSGRGMSRIQAPSSQQ